MSLIKTLKRLQERQEAAKSAKERKSSKHNMHKFMLSLPKIVERCGDLMDFTGPIAHCVSTDLCMGAGVAAAINRARHYNRPPGWNEKSRILEAKEELMGTVFYRADEENPKGGVYNLITSLHYKSTATWEAMKQALTGLRHMVDEEQIERLAMPRIGSGRDKLPWSITREYLIKEAFKGCPITLEIFYKADGQVGC